MNNLQLTNDLTLLLKRYNENDLKVEELRKLRNILSVFGEEVRMDIEKIKHKRMIKVDEKKRKPFSLI